MWAAEHEGTVSLPWSSIHSVPTDGVAQPGPVPKSLQKQRRVLERLVSSECEYGRQSSACHSAGHAVAPTTLGTVSTQSCRVQAGAPQSLGGMMVFSPFHVGLWFGCQFMAL